MSLICPTVTATSMQEYNQQMERLESFVERVHLDFMDGIFAPTKSPAVEQAWWPIGVKADLHIMYQKPLEQLETVISLNPSLIIIHAEAEGASEFFKELEGLGIQRGLALLQATQPDQHKELIAKADHVLIFSGELGHFGGTADMALLNKVKAVRALNKDAEIGWDGGINAGNARQLSDGGVDVLNVGGFISHVAEPEDAYDTLVTAITG